MFGRFSVIPPLVLNHRPKPPNVMVYYNILGALNLRGGGVDSGGGLRLGGGIFLEYRKELVVPD